jgi:hypothetical protein
MCGLFASRELARPPREANKREPERQQNTALKTVPAEMAPRCLQGGRSEKPPRLGTSQTAGTIRRLAGRFPERFFHLRERHHASVKGRDGLHVEF